MLLKTSFPYTGGFLCCPNKMVRFNRSAAGFAYTLKLAEKPYVKRFWGTEKVHRNSIKITVDLWRSGWDSNPRAREGQRFSRPPRYDRFDTTPYEIFQAAAIAAA